MKLLIIGGGAREHAVAWKLKQSPHVENLWCLPGNAGIAQLAQCIDGDVSDVPAIADLAARLEPDLTIVGPEQPLVLGIADEFAGRGLRILGPRRAAAQLEGSKVFAKQFMSRHGIPTAREYGIFDSAADVYTSLCEVDWPVVIKADGLCGGKGVLVTSSPDEATAFIERLMEKMEFGDAGRRVIVEEGLAGKEISYIVLADGEHFLPLAPVRDYKRAFDGDLGPNTGGMGAISSSDLIPNGIENEIQEKVVRPTLAGIAQDVGNYSGFLYFGLMLTTEGPRVLEFNCRLGDPETEALVMRMNFDLADAVEAATSGQLAGFKTHWSPAASACVVLASRGYPGKSEIGKQITGIYDTKDPNRTAVFHGGTKMECGNYYTISGRVLTVSAGADTLWEARERVYRAVEEISFDGMHYRKDIGGKAGTAGAG